MSRGKMSGKVLRNIVRVSIDLHHANGAHSRLALVPSSHMFEQTLPVEITLLTKRALKGTPVNSPKE